MGCWVRLKPSTSPEHPGFLVDVGTSKLRVVPCGDSLSPRVGWFRDNPVSFVSIPRFMISSVRVSVPSIHLSPVEVG